MAGFGSLMPTYPAVDPMAPEAYESWQDREAQAALAAIQAEKKPEPTSVYDTANAVAHFPHRMFGQLTSQPATPEPDQAAMMPETFVNPLVKNTADAIGGAVKSGVTLPGDVATGKVAMVDPATGHTSETAIERAFDTASLGGASVAGTAEKVAATPRAARLAAPSELAAPYHAALEGAAPALLSDSGKPGAVIAAADHASPFVTAAEPALERIARKNGTPEQWRNDLAKYGVTKEEMQHRGLDDLKPGQPISKEELAAKLQPVEIKPVVRGTPPEFKDLSKEQRADIEAQWYDRFEGDTRRKGDIPDVEEYYNALRDNPGDGLHGIFTDPNLSGGPSARYGDYQLPGGANYRERLLTLDNNPLSHAKVQAWHDISPETWSKMGPRERLSATNEMAKAEGIDMNAPVKAGFRGDHWEEPDVVVHRRSTDRTMGATPINEIEDRVAAKYPEVASYNMGSGMPAKAVRDGIITPEEAADWSRSRGWKSGYEDKPGTGKRTLHDEEQQSDWHQAGRDVGYKDERALVAAREKSAASFEALKAKVKANQPAINDATAESLAKELAMKIDDGEGRGSFYTRDEEALAKQWLADKKAHLELYDKQAKAVPDGPFKDSWHRLALHDQIREAAEKGYDRISWTGGRSAPTNPKNLGRTGAEADKAEAGLVKHYDEKLVNTANKIGKAHGVQVEKSEINVPPRGPRRTDLEVERQPNGEWALVDQAGDIHGGLYDSEAAALRDLDIGSHPGGGHTIYHMDIPQSLKDQVLKKGFSMFEDSGKAGGAIAALDHVQQNPKFKKWFGKSAVVDGDGKPMRLYHGTTADFDTFHPEKANIESDWGAGFYFSNKPKDVEHNYAGFGPDLTNKIERRLEHPDFEDMDPAAARAVVLKDLAPHEGATMPVYVKMEKPFEVGGKKETFLDYESGYNPKTEEYDLPESGKLVDFIEALRKQAAHHDADPSEAINAIMEEALDGGISASKLQEILRKDENLGYATDPNTGDLASHEVVRKALQDAGFDGVIDRTVDKKFGSQRRTGQKMAGMDADTVHYIAFEPSQIKSASGNTGEFSPRHNSILRSDAGRVAAPLAAAGNVTEKKRARFGSLAPVGGK